MEKSYDIVSIMSYLILLLVYTDENAEGHFRRVCASDGLNRSNLLFRSKAHCLCEDEKLDLDPASTFLNGNEALQ